MPVEVKELIIRAILTDHSLGEEPESESGTDEIVARCVEQVLEIIERKRER
jgi:hypothetical protein